MKSFKLNITATGLKPPDYYHNKVLWTPEKGEIFIRSYSTNGDKNIILYSVYKAVLREDGKYDWDMLIDRGIDMDTIDHNLKNEIWFEF